MEDEVFWWLYAFMAQGLQVLGFWCFAIVGGPQVCPNAAQSIEAHFFFQSNLYSCGSLFQNFRVYALCTDCRLARLPPTIQWHDAQVQGARVQVARARKKSSLTPREHQYTGQRRVAQVDSPSSGRLHRPPLIFRFDTYCHASVFSQNCFTRTTRQVLGT